MPTARDRGVPALAPRIKKRNWDVRSMPQGCIDVHEAWKGAVRRQIRWFTRTGGDWQLSTHVPFSEENDRHEDSFWAFADVSKGGPDAVVLPEHAARQAIANGQVERLQFHGDRRPVTADW